MLELLDKDLKIFSSSEQKTREELKPTILSCISSSANTYLTARECGIVEVGLLHP